MAGDFGALAGLASTCTGAATLLNAGPHKTLCNQLRCCFGAWVRQIVDGTEHLGGAEGKLERTVEISRQRYRSRWRPWCRGLVAPLVAGRWLTPGVFGARHRCPAMRLVRRKMVAQ
jgi:hypothetical protein